MSHINDTQWQELQDLFEEDFIDLVKGFVSDSKQRVEGIRQAHQDGDNKTGVELAHALKGASANLGATTLSEHCSNMQTICQANMIKDAFNVVEDIENEFANVEKEIEQRISSL